MIDLLFIQMCSVPNVSPRTIWEIIRVESSFNELAVNINHPEVKAEKFTEKSKTIEYAKALLAKGYNIDLGLMQINSKNLERLKMSPEKAMDPCESIRAGSQILKENYARSSAQIGEGQEALKAALSAYNTGNFKGGLSNGYVSKVYGEKVVLKRVAASEQPLPEEDNYPYFETDEP